MTGVRAAFTAAAVAAFATGFLLVVAYLATGGTVNPHPVDVGPVTLPAGVVLAAAGIVALVVTTTPRREVP